MPPFFNSSNTRFDYNSFTVGSVGSLTYSGKGDKAYSREALENFFDGETISSRDFRVSELHGTGKTVAFKTRRQDIGYTEELQHFVNCVSGKRDIVCQSG